MEEAIRQQLIGKNAQLKSLLEQADGVTAEISQILASAAWWKVKIPPYDLAIPNADVKFYHADGIYFKILRVTWVMKVLSVSGDLLLVYDPVGMDSDLWVRAQDVLPAQV